MSAFDFSAILVTLAALLGYINQKLLRLPSTIGMVSLAIVLSIAMILIDRAFPLLALRSTLGGLVQRANLPNTLFGGALSFLLFAGAFHVDLAALWGRRWRVLALATIGVILATALFGAGMYCVFGWFGIAVPFAWCLVLGAIVAPTDPVAVLSVLKRVGLPSGVQATIAGESLFNDGVGVVTFTILLAIAIRPDVTISAAVVLGRFLLEALGGGVLGLATGYVAFVAMRSIDKYEIELMISLALVMETYSIAGLIDVSGPIAVVVAGLLIGNHGTRYAMSETTRHQLETFWSLVDEILNALLFLLIGFELVAIDLNGHVLAAAGAGIVLSLLVRAASVAVPTTVIDLRLPGGAYMIALTWGGLRGGISIALALSLPESSAYRGPLVSACYAVVIFTIIVQGLTLEPALRLARRALPQD